MLRRRLEVATVQMRKKTKQGNKKQRFILNWEEERGCVCVCVCDTEHLGVR